MRLKYTYHGAETAEYKREIIFKSNYWYAIVAWNDAILDCVAGATIVHPAAYKLETR